MPHHQIVGRLKAVRYQAFGGMANLAFTLAQLDAERYTGQTVECLMTYGKEPGAHTAAERAARQMLPEGTYCANGNALAVADGKIWLMGVVSWRLLPPADLRFPTITTDEAAQ